MFYRTFVFRLVLLLTCIASCIVAKSHETHLLTEVKIAGYEGPLTLEMLRLFKAAELLEVVNCNLTSVPDRVLSQLPNLKKLHFENVSSTQIHPDVAEGGLAVEEFFYIHCSWDNPDVEYFNGYKNLNKLVMIEQQYPLVELKANSLNETKMKYLDLTDDGIEKIDDQAFNNLDNLKTLILANNKLKTISKAALTPLINLKKLDLQGNLLESFEIAQIPNLPNLESINLSNNPLKVFDLTGIENVAPKLKKFDLSNTEIPDEVYENLAKKGNKIKKKCHSYVELLS